MIEEQLADDDDTFSLPAAPYDISQWQGVRVGDLANKVYYSPDGLNNLTICIVSHSVAPDVGRWKSEPYHARLLVFVFKKVIVCLCLTVGKFQYRMAASGEWIDFAKASVDTTLAAEVNKRMWAALKATARYCKDSGVRCDLLDMVRKMPSLNATLSLLCLPADASIRMYYAA